MRLIDADETLLKMWNALYKLEDKMEQKNGLQPLRRLDVQAGFEAGQHEVANATPIEERQKGTWISHPGSLRCSSCGVLRIGGGKSNFCPNCGADMREEKPKKGTWIWGYDIRCSNCNYKLQTTGLPSRCPNCGADMVDTAIETLQEPEIIRCKDCKWWTKQPDSLQGRCELSGRYPAGAWYCGNARKREEKDDE